MNSRMDTMKVNSEQVSLMEKACSSMPMEISTEANSLNTLNTGVVNINTQIKTYMKGILSMIRKKDREFLNCLMEISMMGCLLMVNFMDMVIN